MFSSILSRLALVALLACTAGAGAAEPPLVLGDFEDGTPKPFEGKGEVTDAHATHGGKALKLKNSQWLNATPANGLPKDWSKYDLIKMECFNPSDKNVKLTIQIRDNVDKGYWTWHNRYVALLPGENTIQFAIADLWRGEVLRSDIPGSLDPKNISTFNLIAEGGDAIVDHIRLESFQAPKVEVPGLKAFKIGGAKTPGFPGFTKVSENDKYAKDKGYGWTKTNFLRIDDRMHPDNLFRSYISCGDAELAVDLPNGKYRVQLQIEDPGYWEFMQHYAQRQVSAEGKLVVDEKMNGADFMKRYFLNQDAEDFPGEDPFEKYVEPRFPWHSFDVDVADGQLNLAFHSQDTYGNTLSAVLIYPAEQTEKAAQFMKYVKELRRFDWAQRWKPVSKPPAEPKFSGKAAEAASRDGFVLYAVSPEGTESVYNQFPYDHVPEESELLSALEATAAQGEAEPISFGLRPAKPLGKVEVTCSELKNAKGASLPAEALTLYVGRYRFSRFQNPQSGLYSVNERELRQFNRGENEILRADNGMARHFWINVQVPENAAPGLYSGTLLVKTEKGGHRELPIKVTVLPFKLPEPGHLFSLYGIELMPQVYYPEMQADRPRLHEALYRDLRAHGINYITDFAVSVSLQNGKAVITNADAIDKEVALRKKLGFELGTVAAPSGCSLDELAGNGKIKGLEHEQFIAAWHKEITDIFKTHGWPKPYFCYGDEPNVPETLNKLTAANKAVHAVSPDIWMGIAYHVENPESYELLKTLDVHHFKDFCKVEDFKKAKAAGKFLLNCNVGENRPAYGLREWRAMQERQTDGCITYAYTGNHVDIYYDLDAREDDRMMAPPRLDGSFATTARWERIREGIDDFRYARAVETLAQDAKTPKELVDAAKALLEKAYELGAQHANAEAVAQIVAWRKDAQALLTKAGGGL